MRRIIREEEPKTPSTRIDTLSHEQQICVAIQRGLSPTKLKQQLKGELDWIVTKALEKDRIRRYDSASAFAGDVERYIRKEPVEAVAPSAFYKLRKFIARRKLVAATSAIVVLSLLLGIAGTSWQAVRARTNEMIALQNLYISEISTAKREFDQFNMKRSFELVKKHQSFHGREDIRGFEWRWLWKQFNNDEFRLVGHTGEVRAVRFSPDGRMLATGSTDGTVRLWNLPTRKQIWQYKGGRHCNLVDFSPDGRRLLAAFYMPIQDGAVGVIWDVSNPARPRKLKETNEGIGRFSPDGQRLFRWSGPAELDLEGNILRVFPFRGVRHVADDWSTFITRNEIWDTQNDKPLATLPPHTGIILPDWSSAATSPTDPNMIVTGSVAGARVWDLGGNPVCTLPGTAGSPITSIDFSKDGDLVGVYRGTGGIQVFDVSSLDPTSWSEVRKFPAFAGNVLEFSPMSNDLFVAGGEEGFLRVYRTSNTRSSDVAFDHENAVAAVRFSPNSEYVATSMRKGELHLWDIRTMNKLIEISPREDWKPNRRDFFARDWVAFSPNSRLMAIIGPRDTVEIREIETGEVMRCQESDLAFRVDEIATTYSCVEFSHDGTRLYATAAKGDVAFIEVWDLTGESPRHMKNLSRRIGQTPFADSLDVSRNGKLLAVDTVDKGANVYRLPQLDLVAELDLQGESGALAIRFSPDGKYLATSGFDPHVALLWETSNWQRGAALHHPLPVTHVSWSPDGKRLATSDFSAVTKLWDVETGQVVATFRGAVSEFSAASRDGTVLAIAAFGTEYVLDKTNPGRVVLHRAPPLKAIAPLQ